MGSLSLAFPSLDAAVSQFENANPAYNNPMGVQAGAYASTYGSVGVAPNGLAIFPTSEAGMQAGDGLFGNLFNAGDNLSQAIQTYTGLPTNSPSYQNYVSLVSGQTGIDPSEIPPVQNSSTSGLPGIPAPFNPANASSIVAAAPGGGPTAYTAGAAAMNSVLGPSGSSAPGGTSGTISGLLSSISGWLTGSTSGFSFGRIGLFALALIVIAGGVFAFRPIQNVTNAVSRAT